MTGDDESPFDAAGKVIPYRAKKFAGKLRDNAAREGRTISGSPGNINALLAARRLKTLEKGEAGKTRAVYPDDFEGLSPQEIQKRYSDAIEAAIAKTKASGKPESTQAEDLAEVFAKPHPLGIAWESMDFEGATILRGVRRPGGEDEAAS